ncbi:MAG: hypothetical protein KDA37_01355, partial [Planctomycetales bacterium]|nr:hypothetical protein [Planctomycetales bacterium]
FQQAFNNVMFGPWEKIADPYGKMVLGYFGKTPVPPDPEIVKLASEQLSMEPTTRSPIEMNDEDPTKGVAPTKKILEENNLPVTDENVFIVAACKEKGLAFLQGKAELGIRKVEKQAAPTAAASSGPTEYRLKVNGREHKVRVDGGSVSVGGKSYQVELCDQAAASGAAAPAGETTPVYAKMPGVVLKTLVSPGDTVTSGQTLLVLEAMKMEVGVAAPCDGCVAEVSVSAGEQVANGQQLASIA